MCVAQIIEIHGFETPCQMPLEIDRCTTNEVGTQTRPGFVSTADGDAMDRDARVTGTTDRASPQASRTIITNKSRSVSPAKVLCTQHSLSGATLALMPNKRYLSYRGAVQVEYRNMLIIS